MRSLFIVIGLLALAMCHQYPYFIRHQRSRVMKATAAANFTVDFFDQILDHFNTNSQTFKQRYYVVDKHWKAPNGPILLSIAGESPQESPDGLDDEIENLAKKVGALVLTPEHRFFGHSMPFSDLSVENLRYLTVEQEIEDLAYFIKYYQRIINERYSKTSRNKVLTIGGSYAGMISSLTRQTHPEIVDGAWSSSGVVDAVFNFTEFDLQVAISMGSPCAQSARLAQQLVDQMIKGSAEENRKVKRMFNATYMSDDDFLWMLSDATTLPIQYGFWENICNPLIKGMEEENLVQAYADMCNDFFYPKFCGEAGPYLYSDALMKKTSLSSPGVSQRAWWWMVCNQLAYAQAYPGELGIRSPAVTLEFHKQKCDNVYGKGIWPPNTPAFNEKYGAKNPKTTNVYYSNGSQDPWQWACITVSPNPKTLPAHVMVGHNVGHCRDLHAPLKDDPIDVTRTRTAIENWAASILA